MQRPVSADVFAREHTDPEGPSHNPLRGREWAHPWQLFHHAPRNIADAVDEGVLDAFLRPSIHAKDLSVLISAQWLMLP
ncbi:hypothetical protein PM082_015690 [Marasmius tenuissimus]|nr:hypothetical protein PM082_015690 [Marasmius tenuissimus]